MILAVKNLNVRYYSKKGRVHALKGVNFDVQENEIIGLVGESGSGKSTFSSAVLRILPNDALVAGEIIFQNKDILSMPDKDIGRMRSKEISLIFQEPASTFNPVLSIEYQFREFLHYSGNIKNKDKQNIIIEHSLDRVYLKEVDRIIKSYPHQLSGGQLQRVAIAMAIALNPKIIIADEPTSSLDVTIESQIIHLFEELRKKLNLTIIFITHNLDLVRVLCDRVVVLHEGKVEEIAAADSLFQRPVVPYTKALLSSFKALEG
jgi:ABC-type dipeptide/oligopeptide/nickel transport system ATPase component